MKHTAPSIGPLLLLSLAAGSVLLASCEASFDKQDRDFCQATQQRLAANFREQISLLSEAEKQFPSAQPGAATPSDSDAWWRSAVAKGLFDGSEPAEQRLDDLFARAMQTSSQIQVFSDLPLIRETGIQEARGRFDTHVYSEGRYSFTNEPVGDLLQTGRSGGRFREWGWYLEGGVQKKLITGADVKLSQVFIRKNNNSNFTVPNPQAYAKLAFQIIQPILKGGGIEYNRSTIRIAKIDSDIARREFIRQAEAHLLEIARAYWNLYLARSLLVQKNKLLDDTAALVGKLEGRKDIDAMEGELRRARAALAKRRAELVRSEMAVKNAEDRIKALVNDPELLASTKAELVPAEAPGLDEVPLDLKACAASALEHRPEIAQAFLQVKAAAIRKNMAKNELQPQLDAILEMSISGLDDAGCLMDGYDEQWRPHPGFLVGWKFDFPAENNAAKARLRKRRLEERQLFSQLRTTVDTVMLEVKISAREVKTSYRELLSRYASLLAAREDLRILNERWETHGGAGGKPAIGYLQLLIDAQDRLAEAEEAFARSSAIYNLALLHLQRAQGTFLTYQDIEVVRTGEEDEEALPELKLRKKHEQDQPPAGQSGAGT